MKAAQNNSEVPARGIQWNKNTFSDIFQVKQQARRRYDGV